MGHALAGWESRRRPRVRSGEQRLACFSSPLRACSTFSCTASWMSRFLCLSFFLSLWLFLSLSSCSASEAALTRHVADIQYRAPGRRQRARPDAPVADPPHPRNAVDAPDSVDQDHDHLACTHHHALNRSKSPHGGWSASSFACSFASSATRRGTVYWLTCGRAVPTHTGYARMRSALALRSSESLLRIYMLV